MEELSLHLLDLIQNSVGAGASLVLLLIIERKQRDELEITLSDDGCGMSPEFLAQVDSPFTTSRTTRKVGLGIPMFKQAALACAGSFHIESEVGKGTSLTAVFQLSHIDRAPMGDLAGTMLSQVMMTPDKPDYRLEYTVEESAGQIHKFEFDTREIRQVLGGVSLAEPDVVAWLTEYLQEGLESINRGA